MATRKEKRFFIVNRGGAIHEVTEEHARELLQKPGYRSATKAEVKKLTEAKGNQRFDEPLCEPFDPKPVPVEIEVDDEPDESEGENV